MTPKTVSTSIFKYTLTKYSQASLHTGSGYGRLIGKSSLFYELRVPHRVTSTGTIEYKTVITFHDPVCSMEGPVLWLTTPAGDGLYYYLDDHQEWSRRVPPEVFCENCRKEITGPVYYQPGYTYQACSGGCLARLALDVATCTVDQWLNKR